jgi:phosphate transport system substrate-binding protein
MYANMKRMNNDMAVSPIVATLVLIVVAVIGAVAVGTIMGTFSSDVSKNTNAQQAASESATEILIAGSTTLIPAELNLQADYSRANPGVQLNVQGGGSSEGPQAVALGIADIGAVSSGSKITAAQTANPTDPIYQNFYFTQIGGRGVVFIMHNDNTAVTLNTFNTYAVSAQDLYFAYQNVTSAGVTSAAEGNITKGTQLYQREAGSGTMSTAFKFMGFNSTPGTTADIADNGLNNGIPTENGNAAMLTAVQGKAQSLGFVDSGYAITGGITSNTTANSITLLNVITSTSPSGGYTPTHTNIKSALKDWYYGNAQDTTLGPNYPSGSTGLVGGLYWVTKGNSPSAFTGNQVTTAGTSAAGSDVTGLIAFAKSPAEAAAFNNAGMYSMYDFI